MHCRHSLSQMLREHQISVYGITWDTNIAKSRALRAATLGKALRPIDYWRRRLTETTMNWVSEAALFRKGGTTLLDSQRLPCLLDAQLETFPNRKAEIRHHWVQCRPMP
eukprot:GFKZ01000454.1.p1 GENE.GFKZ01000454.1~~GFKZ01000454.1.p1  ORF type:complete len:109 (+),score=2.00 GFKZ01000454.1:196-522(+)